MAEPITKCHGVDEGETCRRDGCAGKIKHRPVENCSCHINPPCGSCTDPRAYCEECDWDERDDVKTMMNGFHVQQNKSGLITTYQRRELDRTKIDWHSKTHTNPSMLKEGRYPEGTTPAEVEKLVKGTFGGRFDRFSNGLFTYIAYTD